MLTATRGSHYHSIFDSIADAVFVCSVDMGDTTGTEKSSERVTEVQFRRRDSIIKNNGKTYWRKLLRRSEYRLKYAVRRGFV